MLKLHFQKILFIFLFLSMELFSDYAQGVKYYDNAQYDQAFPIILKEAKKGVNKAAQYRLAEMYEKGLGTKTDLQKAIYWYKQAASKYAYVDKKPINNETADMVTILENQVGDATTKAGDEFALSKLDTTTPEIKTWASSFIDGDFFGLKPYETNYFLPLSYSKDKPRRIHGSIPYNNLPSEYQHYNENVEVEFQLSLKKEISYDLFGYNEYIVIAYTQEVWWQLYDKSGPFRETNYRPEIFVAIPTSQSLDELTGLKAIKLGFLHESNGQEGYRSRSWNRLYATGVWQRDNLFVTLRAWYRLKEDRKSDAYYDGTLTIDEVIAQSDGDDNPDITHYLGYGDLNLKYLYDKHQFGLLLRNNFDFNENRGALEFSYSYPFFNSPNTFWYMKFFNGYGESLIDYNINVTKASFGFSFSESLY